MDGWSRYWTSEWADFLKVGAMPAASIGPSLDFSALRFVEWREVPDKKRGEGRSPPPSFSIVRLRHVAADACWPVVIRIVHDSPGAVVVAPAIVAGVSAVVDLALRIVHRLSDCHEVAATSRKHIKSPVRAGKASGGISPPTVVA